MTYAINPLFEGEYNQHPNYGNIFVAPGWQPFWFEGTPPWPFEDSQGPCVQPEYKAVTRQIDAHRIFAGSKSQTFFAVDRTMMAGVFQRIPVPMGSELKAVAQVQAWCSNTNEPRMSEREMYAAIGIDLDGGIDPWAESVVWAEWTPVGADFRLLEFDFKASGPAMTAFVVFWNKWRSHHNDGIVGQFDVVPLNEPEDPVNPEDPYVDRSELVTVLVAGLRAAADKMEQLVQTVLAE